MMSVALYVVGFLILIAGLAWAASLIGVPTTWIVVGAVVLAGIAILAIAGNVERREPPPGPPPVR